MYKPLDKLRHSFLDFNQPMGLKMNLDNSDRIEVERTFSLSKRCYGMGCIVTKLEETQLTSIALSVFVTNLFKIHRRILYALLYLFRWRIEEYFRF